jgi:hypothetical protein
LGWSVGRGWAFGDGNGKSRGIERDLVVIAELGSDAASKTKTRGSSCSS